MGDAATSPGFVAKHPRAVAAVAVVTLALGCLWLRPPPWIISTAADARLSATRRGKVLVLVTRPLEEGIEFGKTVMKDPALAREGCMIYTDLIPDGRSGGERVVFVDIHSGSRTPGVIGAHGSTAGSWNVTIFKPDGSVAAQFTPGAPGPFENVTASDMVAWVRFAGGRGPAPTTEQR
jgi:hypothetical protein